MVAIGMLMTWLGYSLSLEGWCLWRDYDLTLGQIMSPAHPYAGKWPPELIPAGQTWPGGNSPAAGGGTASSTASPAATAGTAASKSSSIITKVADLLPGFGFVK